MTDSSVGVISITLPELERLCSCFLYWLDRLWCLASSTIHVRTLYTRLDIYYMMILHRFRRGVVAASSNNIATDLFFRNTSFKVGFANRVCSDCLFWLDRLWCLVSSTIPVQALYSGLAIYCMVTSLRRFRREVVTASSRNTPTDPFFAQQVSRLGSPSVFHTLLSQ